MIQVQTELMRDNTGARRGGIKVLGGSREDMLL